MGWGAKIIGARSRIILLRAMYGTGSICSPKLASHKTSAFGQGRSVVVVALVDVIDGYNNMLVRRSGCLVVDL